MIGLPPCYGGRSICAPSLANMPIYAYRCERCDHAKDVIQKLSDVPLVVCPACGADAFRKQLTAPAFQLKGSGWYVTDFRDGGAKPKAAADQSKESAPEAPPAAAAPPASAVAAQPAAAPSSSSPTPGAGSAGAAST